MYANTSDQFRQKLLRNYIEEILASGNLYMVFSHAEPAIDSQFKSRTSKDSIKSANSTPKLAIRLDRTGGTQKIRYAVVASYVPEVPGSARINVDGIDYFAKLSILEDDTAMFMSAVSTATFEPAVAHTYNVITIVSNVKLISTGLIATADEITDFSDVTFDSSVIAMQYTNTVDTTLPLEELAYPVLIKF